MKYSSHVRFLLAAIVALACCPLAVAQGTRTLTHDTALNVRGSGTTSATGYTVVKFKGGTEVTVDARGNVVRGTLADDTTLGVSGSNDSQGHTIVQFKGGTSVTFDANRGVIAGTLAADTTLNVCGSSNARGVTSVKFKGGTAISFDNQRNVVRGVLAADTALVTSGRGGTPIPYKARTTITFDNARRVAMSWAPIGGNSPVSETVWIVNGTPDPWIFHEDGTFNVLSGKWKGTWRKQSDGYFATITNQGITDTCLIVFSADGKTFRAMRKGEVWRTGVRRQ